MRILGFRPVSGAASGFIGLRTARHLFGVEALFVWGFGRHKIFTAVDRVGLFSASPTEPLQYQSPYSMLELSPASWRMHSWS